MVLPKGGRVGRRQLHITKAQSVMIGALSLNMKAVVNAQQNARKKTAKKWIRVWKTNSKCYFCNRFAREAFLRSQKDPVMELEES